MPQRIILLLLLLLGNSNSLFSANGDVLKSVDREDRRELMSSAVVGEHNDNLFDSILPFQKNLLFVEAFPIGTGDFKTFNEHHTTTSLIYIKRSRSIFPNLGVKEVIFPFHFFL